MLTVSNTLKITALAALLALAACTTKPKSTAEEAPPVAPPAQTSGETTQSSVVAGSVQDFRVNVGDTVHFGYNEFNVGDDDKAILQRQATWLQR